MSGTGFRLCPISGFGISHVEPYGSAIKGQFSVSHYVNVKLLQSVIAEGIVGENF